MARHQTRSATADEAVRLIKEKKGIIRTADALRLGIHPRTLYALRDAGDLDQLSRGVYCLADQQPVSNYDIITVAMRVPRAVICLVSALAFHGITTQVPHTVSVALEKGAEPPRLDHPPLTVHHFSHESLIAGMEEHLLDGVTVRVYSPEKTLADCFKFRNQIGTDVVIEALRLYRARKPFDLGELLRYARICRVEAVMRPYLEAIYE